MDRPKKYINDQKFKYFNSQVSNAKILIDYSPNFSTYISANDSKVKQNPYREDEKQMFPCKGDIIVPSLLSEYIERRLLISSTVCFNLK